MDRLHGATGALKCNYEVTVFPTQCTVLLSARSILRVNYLFYLLLVI